MHALVLGFMVAIFGGEVGAQSQDVELQTWVAKPQFDLSKLGVTYWRVEEPWADRDAVVTIDDQTIAYSAACDAAIFAYKQHWDWGYLEVHPASRGAKRCGEMPSEAFLRFYYFLRESDSVKSSEGSLVLGEALIVTPYIRLRRFEPVGLEFRRWIITEYFDGARLTAPNLRYSDDEHLQGAPATMPPPVITFDRGELEGAPSCGALMGGYTLTGQSLKMHAGLLLRGFCPPSLLRQNDRVLAALRRAGRVDPNGAQMVLRGDHGEVEVVLAPA